MKLHFGRPEPLNFDTLICEMADSEFKNVTRSTIPLLAYWRSPNERLSAICEQLGIAVPNDIQLCFEYPVPSVGRAKASFTDIMAISDSLCVALEGKSTEGDYNCVKDWLSQGGNSRPLVLARWLQFIANKTGLTFSPTDFSQFDKVTYQMIHRTASACSLNKPRTVIVYQVFDVNQKLPNYKKKLTELATAIGAAGKIDVLLNIIKANRTKEYKTLEEQIGKLKAKSHDKKETPQLVRNAILDGNLFEFDHGTWEHITKSDVVATPKK